MSFFSALAKIGEIVAPIEKVRTFIHDDGYLENFHTNDELLSSSSTLPEENFNETDHRKKGNEQSHLFEDNLRKIFKPSTSSYSLGYEGRQSRKQSPQKAKDYIVTSWSERRNFFPSKDVTIPIENVLSNCNQLLNSVETDLRNERQLIQSLSGKLACSNELNEKLSLPKQFKIEMETSRDELPENSIQIQKKLNDTLEVRCGEQNNVSQDSDKLAMNDSKVGNEGILNSQLREECELLRQEVTALKIMLREKTLLDERKEQTEYDFLSQITQLKEELALSRTMANKKDDRISSLMVEYEQNLRQIEDKSNNLNMLNEINELNSSEIKHQLLESEMTFIGNERIESKKKDDVQAVNDEISDELFDEIPIESEKIRLESIEQSYKYALEKLENKLGWYESQAIDTSNEMHLQRDELIVLKKRLNEAEAMNYIERLKLQQEEILSLHNFIEKSENLIIDYESRLTHLNNELEKQKDCEDLHSDAIRNMINASNKQLSDQTSSNLHLENKLHHAESMILSTENKLQELTSLLSEEKLDFYESLKIVEKRLQISESDRANVQDQLQHSKDETMNIQNYIKESQQDIMIVQEKLENCRFDLVKYQQKLTDSEATISELQEDLNISSSACKDLQGELDYSNSALNKVREQCEDSRKESINLEELLKINENKFDEEHLCRKLVDMKLADEQTRMQRLEDTIEQLHNFEETVVDRTLIANLVVSYFQRKRSLDILMIISKVLSLDDSQLQIVGLKKLNETEANSMTLFSSILSTIFIPWDSRKIEGNNLAELWVNFLLLESEDPDSTFGSPKKILKNIELLKNDIEIVNSDSNNESISPSPNNRINLDINEFITPLKLGHDKKKNNNEYNNNNGNNDVSWRDNSMYNDNNGDDFINDDSNNLSNKYNDTNDDIAPLELNKEHTGDINVNEDNDDGVDDDDNTSSLQLPLSENHDDPDNDFTDIIL